MNNQYQNQKQDLAHSQKSSLPLTFVVFDLEWDLQSGSNDNNNNNDQQQQQLITAASFVDSNGTKKVFLLQDYYYGIGSSSYNNNDDNTTRLSAERQLLIDSVTFLFRYEYSFGYNTTSYENNNTGKGVNSDLVMLDRRIRYHGFNSIVAEYNNSLVITTPKNIEDSKGWKQHKHIDAYVLYTKKIISGLFGNQYQNNWSLDNVAKVIIGRGKYKQFTGKDFSNMNIEDKRAYVLEDSQLLYDILAKDDFKIIRLMVSISKLTSIPFHKCCKYGPSTLWASVLDKYTQNDIESLLLLLLSSSSSASVASVASIASIASSNIMEQQDRKARLFRLYEYLERDNYSHENNNDNDNSINNSYSNNSTNSSSNNNSNIIVVDNNNSSSTSFEGGEVFKPLKGEHKNMIVLDVTSMYPSIISQNNLCYSTVNCECCKNDPSAVVPDYVLSNYWICKKFDGVFTKAIRYFLSERLRQKNEVKDKIMAEGLKILINSGYGVFGNEFFKYRNLNTAKLVTAYGRYILNQMKQIAINLDLGFEVVAGDTDSIFLVKSVVVDINNNDDDNGVHPKIEIKPTKEEIDLLIERIQTKLGVKVEHEKTFRKAIIIAKKNYLGILEDKDKDTDKNKQEDEGRSEEIKPAKAEIIVKGLGGKKIDRVKWVRDVFNQMVQDYRDDIDPVPKIREAFADLEQWGIKDAKNVLLQTVKINKDPEKYQNNCIRKQIAYEKDLHKNDSASYYLADKFKTKSNGSSSNFTFDFENLSIDEYKKMLKRTIEEPLAYMGHDIDKEVFGKISLMEYIYGYGAMGG